MKRFAVVLVLVVITAGLSYGQSRQTAAAYGRATTTITKYGFSERVFNWTFVNDTTGGVDTLWAIVGRDTSITKRIPILKGQTVTLTGIQSDSIAVKASANSIPFRAWGIH